MWIGEFLDDKRNAFGIMTSLNGDNFEGEYRDDKINGNGNMAWADGASYIWDFLHDMKNGHFGSLLKIF